MGYVAESFRLRHMRNVLYFLQDVASVAFSLVLLVMKFFPLASLLILVLLPGVLIFICLRHWIAPHSSTEFRVAVSILISLTIGILLIYPLVQAIQMYNPLPH